MRTRRRISKRSERKGGLATDRRCNFATRPDTVLGFKASPDFVLRMHSIKRSRQLPTVLAGAALTMLLVASCELLDDRPMYRCLEGVGLGTFALADLPRQTPGTVSHSSGSQIGDIFDTEAETFVDVDDPAAVAGVLCDRLETRLSERCDVRRLSTGASHCAFSVGSPHTATTGPDGVHHHRHMEGRVTVLAQSNADGRTRLVLTATEWPG